MEVFLGGKTASHSAGKYCGSKPSVKQYNEAIHIRFVSGTANAYSRGFRIQFAYRSWKLKKIRDELWNCSVPTFKQDYASYFPCDGLLNCVHGEDERDCPYTNTKECGIGQWWLGGRCYEYVVDTVTTWPRASLACQERGGYLVSLNSPEEWRVLEDMLSRVQTGDMYVGLRSFSQGVSKM